MKLYNTLTRKLEEFKPLNPPNVTLYTCGPTVYDYSHIGHARAYVINDLLRRSFPFLGFTIKHVMNITDVGHLTGDDDSGIDKLEKGAKKYNKSVWDVVKFYTDYFFKTTDALNILRPDIVCPATKHIKEMIEMIKKLENKGLTYETEEAIYFDVSKFPKYGQLSGQIVKEKLKGARADVYVDPKKKNNADFSLWFKRVGRFKDHTMHWDSPWGDGFPGWHIECSAMSTKYLGETIDIHTGGVDHISVHHENEIAQSEGASGKQFVRLWFHYNFLTVNGEKMSKSLGNILTIDDIVKKNYDPLALRYLFLQTHYRQLANFTWEALTSAQEALKKLQNIAIDLKSQIYGPDESRKTHGYRQRFVNALADDFQIPQTLAVTWEMLKSDLSAKEKLDLLLDFDKVFGLRLIEVKEEIIPKQIVELAEKRKIAREKKDFNESDVLRNEINSSGYSIEDIKNNNYKLKILK
ncbi:cysteine--tRNA ligase [Patescibacteria group bacterium]|nr:cysteine--tRNA ligase [Patescibacteria group bacterium]